MKLVAPTADPEWQGWLHAVAVPPLPLWGLKCGSSPLSNGSERVTQPEKPAQGGAGIPVGKEMWHPRV